MKALILAGGRGSRLDEFTKDKNKAMLKIYDKTLLEYNLDRAVEAGVKEIIIIIGYKGDEIRKKIGNEYKRIKVKYAVQKEQKGLVHAIECAKEALEQSDFILMLGDEILIDSNIKSLIKKFRDEELFAVCGGVLENDKSSIKRTYSVMFHPDGRIFRLVEKPRFPTNNLKGTGHCVFRNEILDYIDKTPINMYRNQKEMVDMIQCAIDDGKNVKIHKVAEKYMNINNFEDLNTAKELIKQDNPKVLIVHNQMKYYGGGELLIVELANWLTKRGIKNDILALSKSKEVGEKLINTNIIIPEHDVDLNPPGYKDIKDILKAIKAFRKKLKEIKENYDVINFHDFPVTWILWPRRKPAVWFMNLPPSLFSKPDAGFFLKMLHKSRVWFDKFIVRNSVDIITVAEDINMLRAKQRYGMHARMVYFGADYNFFSKGKKINAAKKYNLEKKFVIIQSGIICNVKNQFESVKTINKIKNKIPNILLILAGRWDEDYKRKIEDYIKKENLENNILFTGNLKREELRDLYKAANIGLFPLGKQGGVLAPIEVLCAGIPIIVSEDAETAPLVKNENLGIVTKDYSKAILDIKNNSKEWEKKTKTAGNFVKKNLSWEAYSDRMIRAFKDAWKKYKK
jgi:dTDP-glucose pyrophosphorylase